MKAFKSGIVGLVILAGTALSAFAGQEPRRGGHDGGGAGVQLSTEAEVREAITWAMEDLRKAAMKEKESPSWLFWASSEGPEIVANNGRKASVTDCLYQPFFCENLNDMLEKRVPQYNHAWDFLKLSPLDIKGLGEGPCPAVDKKDAAASVSAYKVGAELCFSVDVLRKTPRDVMRAQVASILAHEMAHLMGHGEEIAQGVQDAVYGSFSVAAFEQLEWIREDIMMQLFSARMELKSVADGFAGDNADLRLMRALGVFRGRITTAKSLLPVGNVKEPSLAAKPEMWERVHKALSAPSQRMYNLELDLIEGKSSVEQQMEQGALALKEFAAAEKLVAEFLGQKLKQ